jgi:hypothetical protein
MECPALETYRNIDINDRSEDIPSPQKRPIDISNL